MVVHSFNLSTWLRQMGLNLRLAWSTYTVSSVSSKTSRATKYPVSQKQNNKTDLLICYYLSVHVSAEFHQSQSTGSPGAGVTGGCDPVKFLGAGNRTWVFSENSKCFSQMSDLSSP